MAAGGIAGGAGGSAAAGAYRSHDDPEEYSSYDDLFRPVAHESALDMAAASSGPSSVAATAMGATAYQQQQHYTAQDHYQQDQYYDPNYYNYDRAAAAVANGAEVLGDETESTHPHQQQHMSLSSELGTQISNGHAPEYHPYRYPDESYDPQDSRYSQQQQQQSLGPAAMGGIPATGHNMHGYGSEDYTQNNHFLRELRE